MKTATYKARSVKYKNCSSSQLFVLATALQLVHGGPKRLRHLHNHLPNLSDRFPKSHLFVTLATVAFCSVSVRIASNSYTYHPANEPTRSLSAIITITLSVDSYLNFWNRGCGVVPSVRSNINLTVCAAECYGTLLKDLYQSL